MNVGIHTYFGFKYPFSQIIKMIKDAGFHSVMTWWGDEFVDNIGAPKETQPDIIRNNGLEIENTHLPFTGVNNIWEDSLDGQDIFDKYLSYVGECKTYGIPTAVLHVSSGDSPPPYGQVGLDRFKRLVEEAERKDITIALENLRRPEYLDFVFDNIESDKLKFCYDSGHENCFTPNIDYLARYGNKLAALHLHDNDGSSDQHLPPFSGSINWKRIAEHLKNIDYQKPLSLEINSQFILEEAAIPEYLSKLICTAHKIMGGVSM